MEYKVYSIFSGCGGMDYGFHHGKKYSMADVVENDKDSMLTYNWNYKSFRVPKSVTECSWKKDSNSILVGGPPCQDFTQTNNNRKGIDGGLGSLVLEYIRAVDEIRPKVFLFENVVGFSTMNKRKPYRKFIFDMEELGYICLPKIINYADFGVPQLRRRIFVVGSAEGKFKFPRKNTKIHKTCKEAFKSLPPWNNEKRKIGGLVIKRINSIPAGGNNDDAPKHLQVRQYRNYTYRRVHPDKPSKTIIGRGGGGSEEYHYLEPRPLTNRERARLQGFPDDYIFHGSYSSVRSQICNAVPPLISTIFAEEIRKQLL
jgi:DNA (cytosine-5)-methyltransferase 1